MAIPKSIFRYPGGKVKAIKFIQPFWAQIQHEEYREPFVGGGSVFIAKPFVEFNWINDLDKDLIAFYKTIAHKGECEKLIADLLSQKITRELYDKEYKAKPNSQYLRARRCYTLNRCSFSGITRWNAYIGDVRYNIQNAQHLIRVVGEKLRKFNITCTDFEEVITARPKSKKGVFLFLDPPYAESRQIVAYNVTFAKEDHLRLARVLKQTPYPFLLTYDDCKFIRELYSWAHLYAKTWTYSLANSRVHHNPRESGNELFISNFKLKKDDRDLYESKTD